jgi:hypothetical protein
MMMMIVGRLREAAERILICFGSEGPLLIALRFQSDNLRKEKDERLPSPSREGNPSPAPLS